MAGYPNRMTVRERTLRRLLNNALNHIESELAASGWDEVKQHPVLRSKHEFVERTRKRLKELDAQ